MDRAAGVFGLLGALVWLLAPVYFSPLDPNFDATRDIIGDLGAIGAPYAIEVRWLWFLPTGLLLTCFAVCALIALPRSALTLLGMLGIMAFAVAYVGAVFFPCRLECLGLRPGVPYWLHGYVVGWGYILPPITMWFLGYSARQWPGGQWIAFLGYASAMAALVCLPATLDPYGNTNGDWQRALEASIMVPVMAISCYLLMRSKSSTAV